MAEKEDLMEAADSAPSMKKSLQTSLLDSGEDFEVLDEEDIDDDPPPLEDAGGGKSNDAAESGKTNVETHPEPPAPVEEWLDVLGTLNNCNVAMSECNSI